MKARLVSLLGACALLFTFQISPASAGHGSGDWDPDNRQQDVEWWSLNSGGQLAATVGGDQLNRTLIDISSGPAGGSDIRVEGYTYSGADWIGLTNCTNVDWTRTPNRCDSYTVRFNEAQGYMANASTALWRHLGCHEFGHTGSVNERPPEGDSDKNSCMRQAWSSPIVDTLDQHDIDAINAEL
jgi:hypothetical protein